METQLKHFLPDASGRYHITYKVLLLLSSLWTHNLLDQRSTLQSHVPGSLWAPYLPSDIDSHIIHSLLPSTLISWTPPTISIIILNCGKVQLDQEPTEDQYDVISAILSHLFHLCSYNRQNSSIAPLITRQRTIWFPDDRCTVMRLRISQMTHLLSHGHDRMGMISLVFLLLDGIHMLFTSFSHVLSPLWIFLYFIFLLIVLYFSQLSSLYFSFLDSRVFFLYF